MTSAGIVKQNFLSCTELVVTLTGGDDVDLWIQNPEFASSLQNLFDCFPESWLRPSGLRHLSPKAPRCGRPVSQNRAIRYLQSNRSWERLDAKTIETIWKWADDPALFLAESNPQATSFSDGASSPAAPLDSVCLLLAHLDTQKIVDRVRRRLLLYFLARIVDEKIHAIGTQDDLATMLVEMGLISKPSYERVLGHLAEWLSQGRQYLCLVEKLAAKLGRAREGEGKGRCGGYLVCLPPCGESNWYKHSHASGSDGDELTFWLQKRGVVEEAQMSRLDGRNAFDVVDKLFQGLMERSDYIFVPHGMAGSSRRPAKKVRSRRPYGSTLSPTLGTEAARHPMDPALSPAEDPGNCTLDSSFFPVDDHDDCHIVWPLPGSPGHAPSDEMRQL